MSYKYRKPRKTPDDYFIERGDEVIVEIRTSAADAEEVTSKTRRGLVWMKESPVSDDLVLINDGKLDSDNYTWIPWPLILSIKKIGMIEGYDDPLIVDPEIP